MFKLVGNMITNNTFNYTYQHFGGRYPFLSATFFDVFAALLIISLSICGVFERRSARESLLAMR
jgi:hypothetical protein